jgi:hypothetical protein
MGVTLQVHVRCCFDIHVSVHHDIIHENDQQDATVQANLLFVGCSTCFERYFRSSLGASKLYYSFWCYTRMLLSACIMGVRSNTPMIPTGSDIRL